MIFWHLPNVNQEVSSLKKTLQKCYDCKLLMGALLTAVSLVVLLLFNRFSVIYATNDDYIMSVLIQAGDDRNIFMNYFLTHFNVILQRLLPFVNWFSLLQLIWSFIAVTAVNFVLMKKQKGIEGLIFSLFFDFLFVATVMVTIHWTQTTALMCGAGFVLLFYALKLEERKGCRIFQLIMALILTVFGSLYRLVAFELSALVFALMCLCFFIKDVSVTMGAQKGFFKAFGKTFRRYLSLMICAVLIVCLALGAELFSGRIKNADPDYQGYVDYNYERSALNDYKVPDFEKNAEFYRSIGVESAEDLNIVLKLHTDKNFYNTGRLHSIAEYSKSKGMGMTSATQLAIRFIKSEISKRIPLESRMGKLAVLGVAGLLGLGVCIVLFLFRNKLKFLFPILLCVIWFFFIKYYGIKLETILFLPLVLMILLTVFFHNRYYFLFCSAMSFITMALYFYQNFSRIRYRVSYTFLLPAILFLLFAYSRDQLQVRFRDPKNVWKVIYAIVAVGASAAVVCYANIKYLQSNYAHVNVGFDDCVQDYVEENEDTFFIYTYSMYPVLDRSFFEPLLPSDCPQNSMIYGDWQMASAYYENTLQENGIEKLFDEMKNSPDKRIILSLSSKFDFVKMYESYYNAHYAEDGETIKLVEEAHFEPEYDNTKETYNKHIGIFKVVTE